MEPPGGEALTKHSCYITPPFTEILSELGNEAETKYLNYKLGDEAKYFNKAQELLKMQGIQARLPYVIDFY